MDTDASKSRRAYFVVLSMTFGNTLESTLVCRAFGQHSLQTLPTVLLSIFAADLVCVKAKAFSFSVKASIS